MVFRWMILFIIFAILYLIVFYSCFLGKMHLYYPFTLQLFLHFTLILHLFRFLHYFEIFSNLLVYSIHFHLKAFISSLLNLHPFFIFVSLQVIQLLMLLSLSELLNHLLVFLRFYFIISHHLFFMILNCHLCILNHHHFLFIIYFLHSTFL